VQTTATVIGLNGQKMIKNHGNTIYIFQGERAFRKKVMGIVTDSAAVEDPRDPASSSIVALYGLFATESDVALMEDHFRAGGIGYGEFKKRLFAAIWETFAPFRQKRAELAADPAILDGILANGAERTRAVALPVIERGRRATGLRLRRLGRRWAKLGVGRPGQLTVSWRGPVATDR
jgi:tryptophanyl-tRNA synthetase